MRTMLSETRQTLCKHCKTNWKLMKICIGRVAVVATVLSVAFAAAIYLISTAI